jgi:Tol biopolymer transport system component
VAISPDGSTLAFVAADSSGNDLLWIRRLDKLDATPLPGTDGAYFPFWSPDSKAVAFFAQRKLKKISLDGGPVQTLCDAPRGLGGSWSSRGDIIFSPEIRSPIYRVSAQGGDSAPVTSFDRARQDRAHQDPTFLPDGEHFLFGNVASPEHAGFYVGSLKSTETRPVVKGTESDVAFSPNGFLLFVRGGVLQAQKFDLGSQELVGAAYPIAEGALGNGFSVSANGRLAYRVGAASRTQLTWLDRTGAGPATLGALPGWMATPALSPDGATVAVSASDGNIWLLDAVRGTGTKFTTDAKSNLAPVWSPDGRSILYISDREGFPKIYQRLANGAGQEQLVDGSPALQKLPYGWSADGRYVTMFQTGTSGEDLFVLPMFGDRRPQVYLQTKFSEYENRLSPDGKWMVYVSEQSDRPEVYVQPFPRSDERWKISVAGGVQPMWRHDGKELFYLALNAMLTAVDVKTTPTFESGVPQPLFQARTPLLYSGWSYAPTRDGQRFLVSRFVDDASAVGVVLNWPNAIPR